MSEPTKESSEKPIELTRTLPSRIKSVSLLSIAASFREACENLDFLRVTPQILLSKGYAESASFSFFFALAKTDDIRPKTSGFDAWFEEVQRRVSAAATTEDAQKLFREHLWETANRQLASLIGDKQVGNALRSLKLARIVLGWTAFECLAGDGWEAAINDSPILVGHQAFKSLPPQSETDDGLTRKQVPVGLLAKYGFDLRRSLGTVLRPKFDFTSVSGIQCAYEAAFGKLEELKHIFADGHLSNLEAARHLIVHRHGIVDEQYVSRTGAADQVGHALAIEDDFITDLLNAMMISGCELFELVDREFSPAAV